MLDKRELLDYAKYMRNNPWQQERHYIQSLILFSLADFPMIFKGGTYLWFFHGLNRFSEDLDFTAQSEINSDLDKSIIKGLNYFGVDAEVLNKNSSDTSLCFRVDAIGPLYTNPLSKVYVYVEISKRENIINEPIPISFSNDSYKLPTKIVLGMNLEEVTAEKVRAIFCREKPRDIFDLYYLVETKKIPFSKSIVNKKLEYYNYKFTLEAFSKRLNLMKNNYKKEVSSLTNQEIPEYDLITKTITNWISK